METIIFGIFAAELILCIALGGSILYALLIGFVLFFTYGLLKKHSFRQMIQMSLEGILKVKNMLLIFLLIGVITAVWRAAGTIPMIIMISSKLIVPTAFILITFLLNCMVSVLTGTAFGTAATIGVICMTIGNILGENPLFMGGAILSGIYFGDRCSPMSTSALLVSQLTGTDIYRNIKKMIQTAVVPFAVTCVVYLLIGLTGHGSAPSLGVLRLFSENFVLNWITLIPAVIIIVLSLFKMKIRDIILISILMGGIICMAVQHINIIELLRLMIIGYRAKNPQLAVMMNGGGMVSMLKSTAIVFISASYSGIFEKTGMLENLKKRIALMARTLTPFGSTLVTSIFTGMATCNQSLTIMLTYQLCSDTIADENKLAITLEDTAAVIPPLIPWSVAGAVPIAAVSAPTSCILAACYLYLLPITSFAWAKISMAGRTSAGYKAGVH